VAVGLAEIGVGFKFEYRFMIVFLRRGSWRWLEGTCMLPWVWVFLLMFLVEIVPWVTWQHGGMMSRLQAVFGSIHVF
jgi:hypothetical protein